MCYNVGNAGASSQLLAYETVRREQDVLRSYTVVGMTHTEKVPQVRSVLTIPATPLLPCFGQSAASLLPVCCQSAAKSSTVPNLPIPFSAQPSSVFPC